MKQFRYIFLLALIAILAGCSYKDGHILAFEGLESLQEGKYAMAARKLRRASRTESTPAVHYNLGVALYEVGNLKASTKALEQVLKMEPEHIGTQEMLARIKSDQGQPDQAITELERLFEKAGSQDRPRILNALALAESEAGHDDYALMHLLQAIQLNYRYAPSHYNQAHLLATKYKKNAAAIDCLELYLRLAPEDISQAKKGDKLLRKLKDLQKRVSVVTLDQTDQNRLESLIKEGDKLLNARQWERAKNIYRQASELAPNQREPAYKLALSAYYTKDYDQAARLLSQVIIPQWPNYSAGYQLMSYVRASQNRYDEAHRYGQFYLGQLGGRKADAQTFRKWLDSVPTGEARK